MGGIGGILPDSLRIFLFIAIASVRPSGPKLRPWGDCLSLVDPRKAEVGVAEADLKKLRNWAGIDRSNVNVGSQILCNFFPAFCVATN